MLSEGQEKKWERLTGEEKVGAKEMASFGLNRLINLAATGEGSNLPPKMVIGIRVQAPKRFRILKQTEETGQTRIVLSWENEYAMQRYNPQYRIKISDRTKSVEFQSLLVAGNPPCEVLIPGPSGEQRTYILMVETILSNGLTSLQDSNPTCSTQCLPL